MIILWEYINNEFIYLNKHIYNITQILFNNSTNILLSCDKQFLCLWSLESFSLVQSISFKDNYLDSIIGLSNNNNLCCYLQYNNHSFVLSLWNIIPQLSLLFSIDEINIDDYNDELLKLLTPSICFCKNDSEIVLTFPKNLMIFKINNSLQLKLVNKISYDSYGLLNNEVFYDLKYDSLNSSIIGLTQYYNGLIEEAEITYCGSVLFINDDGTIRDSVQVSLQKSELKIMVYHYILVYLFIC